VKGRATARFRLIVWLGRRLDGMSCHRWPIVGDALSVRHGGELRQQSWNAATACSDLEMTSMWWRCSAAVQRRKEDGVVGEMAGAVQRSSALVLLQ
jgi:hypothetical protein